MVKFPCTQFNCTLRTMAKDLVKIGETTALIPEAGSAVKEEWLLDGQSGKVYKCLISTYL